MLRLYYILIKNIWLIYFHYTDIAETLLALQLTTKAFVNFITFLEKHKIVINSTKTLFYFSRQLRRTSPTPIQKQKLHRELAYISIFAWFTSTIIMIIYNIINYKKMWSFCFTIPCAYMANYWMKTKKSYI